MIIESHITLDKPTEPFHETLMNKCLKYSQLDSKLEAFIDSENDSSVVTFREIYDRVATFTEWLKVNGFKKGDMILLFMHNSWQIIVAYLGAWSAGLTVTACNMQLTQYELRKQLLDTSPCMIITDYDLLSKVRTASVDLNIKRILCTGLPGVNMLTDIQDLDAILFASTTEYKPVDIDLENDLMFLPYSSGTSGSPKGIMLFHICYAQALKAQTRNSDENAKALGLPGYKAARYTVNYILNSQIMGMFATFYALYNGTTQINLKKFEINRLLQLVQKYKMSSITVYPSMIMALVDSPKLESFDLSSLRVVACGGAPLSDVLIDKLKAKLPHVIVRQGYGMSEMCFTTHIATISTPPQSVGKIIPGVQMKILTEDGKLCGPGEKGEIWFKSHQMMRGYWKQEELTKSIIDADGFMRTGDIGHFEENGDTYICDRIKDVLKIRGGYAVAPAELESVLLEIPGIKDACVVGIPDETGIGIIPRAFIVGTQVPEYEIHAFFKERLAAFKQLSGGIEYIDCIPRNSTGKALRRELAAEYLKRTKALDE